jgi:hypothetical protein
MTTELGEPATERSESKSILWYLKLFATSLTVASTVVCVAFIAYLFVASRSQLAETTRSTFVLVVLSSWCAALVGALLTFTLVRRGEICYLAAIVCLICLPLCVIGWFKGTYPLVYSIGSFRGQVDSNLRDVAIALEGYRVYNGHLPASLSELNSSQPPYSVGVRDVFSRYQPGSDPWHRSILSPFDYYTDVERFWILRSVGPDGDKDIDVQALGEKMKTTPREQWNDILLEYCEQHLYVPGRSGGLVASGDIIKTGP